MRGDLGVLGVRGGDRIPTGGWGTFRTLGVPTGEVRRFLGFPAGDAIRFLGEAGRLPLPLAGSGDEKSSSDELGGFFVFWNGNITFLLFGKFIRKKRLQLLLTILPK